MADGRCPTVLLPPPTPFPLAQASCHAVTSLVFTHFVFANVFTDFVQARSHTVLHPHDIYVALRTSDVLDEMNWQGIKADGYARLTGAP